ncbi:hypothetical protein GGR50DRAFT_697579 [Xylaria sp. CBS 124048]|nr:hypothetical protein GGR50DRAFT_697579 [Xylaria sp. CBS 124048]
MDDHSGDSDYGSDFSVEEEQLVDKLLTELDSRSNAGSRTASIPSAPSLATMNAPRNLNGQSHASLPAPPPASLPGGPMGGSVSPRLIRHLSPHNQATSTSSREPRSMLPSVVQYPDLSQALSSLKSEATPAEQGSSPPALKQEREQAADTRSPLQRFRAFPRRPLSVSDLAAGAWCELQHWYTLTMLPGGKRTRTPAMRGGSRVHKTLEDEVHSAVHVSIASKEEAFALRLWNFIQGLRTLRETGLTRELEVWGKVEGEFINGVIDQLSHESPDPSFEAELSLSSSNGSSITSYLGPKHKTVYLTDVKTRGSSTLPTGTALRPARVQLFLYHRLLSDIASNKLDFSAVFERYGLQGDARFSDDFMAQIGCLHDEIFYDADSEVEEVPAESDATDLIRYRSISQMIPLLRSEIRETFPHGAMSVGNLLAVQYRHRDDGRIIGNNSFPNDPNALHAYVKDNMRWWRGDRKPNGVAIEETYKCGWCEFAEGCQWRKEKEIEFLSKKRPAQASPAP